jgi:hypothetical protein
MKVVTVCVTKNLVHKHSFAGDFFKAVTRLSECIELNPKNSSYVVYRALVRCAQGDVAGAALDAARIVVVDSSYPRHPEPVLAGFLQKLGEGVAVSGYKTRYFVLKERFLWYYKTHTDLIPIDVILLVGYSVKSKSDVKVCTFILSDFFFFVFWFFFFFFDGLVFLRQIV